MFPNKRSPLSSSLASIWMEKYECQKTANVQSIEIYDISYIEGIRENPVTFGPFDVHLVKKFRICFLQDFSAIPRVKNF